MRARPRGSSTGILSATGRIRCGEPVGQPGVSPGYCVSAGKVPAGPTDKMSVLRKFSLEEVRAHDPGQGVKIEERKKVDCAELAIDCRWSTDSRANCQICAQ